MARRVSVQEFQAQQRGDDQVDELEPIAERMVAKTGRATDVMAVAKEAVDGWQFCGETGPLAGLYVKIEPDATRGQVVLAIRERATEQRREFTEADVQAAADRVWGDMGSPRPTNGIADDELSYPHESDLRCEVCGEPVTINSAEEDAQIDRAYDQGLAMDIRCDACPPVEPVQPKPEDRATDQVATVAPDGIVEAVRPAEMTPDRGPDVGTTHHTLGAGPDWRAFNPGLRDQPPACSSCGHIHNGRCTVDVDDFPPGLCGCEGPASATGESAQVDADPRFSGGGAADDDEDRFPVPSDASFANKLFADAPELANIAEKLIGEHGYLDNLRACRIRYLWKRKTGVSKGRLKIGYIARVSELLAHAYPGVDFVIWLSASTARESRFSPTQVEAAILHQLCHVGEDDTGNWIKLPHDFEGFAAEVRAFGAWTEDLKVGSRAFTTAVQLGLELDADDEDDEDLDDRPDDGAEDEYDSGAYAGDGPDEDRPADPDVDYDDEGLADYRQVADMPTDAEIDASLAKRGG